MLEPIKDEERSHKMDFQHPKVIRCRMCKSDTTRILSNGNPIWIRDKDIKGDLTGSFLCYRCAYDSEKACYKCGVIGSLVQMTKRYNDDGAWTGTYMCVRCRHKSREKGKSLDSIVGRCSTGHAIVSKVLGVPVCSIYIDGIALDSWKLPIGLIENEDYGIVDVKTAPLRNRRWRFEVEKKVIVDTYFFLGFDEEWTNVDTVFIFPNEEWVSKNKLFVLAKNSSKHRDCEWFEVDAGPYNDAFKEIKNESNIPLGDKKEIDIKNYDANGGTN